MSQFDLWPFLDFPVKTEWVHVVQEIKHKVYVVSQDKAVPTRFLLRTFHFDTATGKKNFSEPKEFDVDDVIEPEDLPGIFGNANNYQPN